MHHNQKNKPYMPSIQVSFLQVKKIIFIFYAVVERRHSRVVRAACTMVVSSRLGLAIRQRESSLCQPNSKWVSFSNQGR